MADETVFAIFDLDYTLTKRGTWGRFVWKSVKYRPHLWLPLLFSTAAFQLQYKMGQRPRGAVKKNMMRWSLQRHKRLKLETMAESFAMSEVSNGFRPGGVAALDYHRSQGHEIIIASAAVDLVVAPIAKALGVKHYVSTELSWAEDGRLLSQFASPNCYGVAKLKRVKSLLENIGAERFKTIFYSDSKADLPVLEYSDLAIVVDPSAKFKPIAEAKGMPIQHWMKGHEGFKIIKF